MGYGSWIYRRERVNPRRHKRKGVSPVISTVILSAVVITIGGALWSYTQSATTVIANDYIDGVMELMKTALERFTVEYICNNSDGTVLHVWIYNYGDVNVTADVYAYIGNQTYSTDFNDPFTINSGALGCANVTVSTLSSGDQVAVKVHSRRQNNAYETYVVP